MDTYKGVRSELLYPGSTTNKLSQDMQTELGFGKMESNVLSVIIENIYEAIVPAVENLTHPYVQAHDTNRIVEWKDFWWLVQGFKDGAIMVTGNNSKWQYCNGNITQTNDVFWYSYLGLFGPSVVSTNFNPTNRDNSLTSFFGMMNDTMRWPYYTVYSCYWAATTMYEPYYGWQFPNWEGIKNEDGTWPQLNIFEQAAFNIVFNLGFITSDFIWLI